MLLVDPMREAYYSTMQDQSLAFPSG